MKKKKIVYYNDEIKDDFSGTRIKQKPLKENFKYIKKGPIWCFFAWVLYYIFAIPFGAIFCFLKFRLKVENRKVLKENKKRGYFVYANHTQHSADAFIPALCVYPRKNYVLVNKDSVSIKGLKNIVLMVGGIPVANTFTNMKLMRECIKERVAKQPVTIYPEATIWPYNTKIRNFKSSSFKYPVDFDTPVYSSTMVYRKRTSISRFWNKKPFATIYIDGPFYPDKTLNKKEATEKLRDEVYTAMTARANVPDNYEYIKYIKKEEIKK